MRPSFNRQTILLIVLLAVAITGYWLLPISGKVYIALEEETEANSFPRVRIEPEAPRPGERATAIIADTVPWVYVDLLVNGQEKARYVRLERNPLYVEWYWSFTVPDDPTYELVFYHDCDRGCVQWARHGVNTTVNIYRPSSTQIPTKLGVVFANPQRDWHNRSGWVVELTYARLADAPYWGIEDLAARVTTAAAAGQHVLVRVDYDQGQSIPPPGDEQALQHYLAYLRRLARDDRLRDVYGYVIGSSYNAAANNTQSPQQPVTPQWYGRVFNGYGTPVTAGDNVVAVVRAENRTVRVLVGPVQPWVWDQDGDRPFTIDIPWLNYFHTLTAAIAEAAQERAVAGIPLAAPDGFAIQAPGRPDAPQLSNAQKPLEPQIDLRRQEWDGAQAGFRVYEDWLAVVNAHPPMAGLPLYITSSNTYHVDADLVPAENYIEGWLTTALDVANREPQIYALCWFVDYLPIDEQWNAFSLTNPQGAMVAAAAEFERLLQRE